MNQAEQVLLQAIQKSLWNTNVTFPEDTDWNAVLQEAEKQAVLGIVIPIAPKEVQTEWKNKSGYGILHYIRALHAQAEITELMQFHHIPMAILKGAAAAIYYPVPSRRTMGDIDFIVPEDCYEKANRLMLGSGYQYGSEHPDKRHKSYPKNGISFEIHVHFSYQDLDIERYIAEGLEHIEERVIDHVRFQMLPELPNGLVLLAHMIHHFKTGLGLRQMIDWMMFVERTLDDAFWNKAFKSAAEETGLIMGAMVATKACQMYLGLSDRITWCQEADPMLCDELMESLMSSGNFGRKRGSGASFESVSVSIREKGVFRYLQKSGEMNWAACHRHQWLKPFAWIYQGSRVIRKWFQSKRSGRLVREDIERSRRRTALYQVLIGAKKQ